MNEEINLKLSQLVDNELSRNETIKLLDLVNETSGLEEKLSRYEFISRIIRQEDSIQLETDFVDQVSLKIQQEPVVFSPFWRRSNIGLQAVVAIAASVAVVSVIVFGDLSLPTDSHQTNLTIARDQEAQQKLNVAESAPHSVDKRFVEYLEAHDNSLYSAGSPGFQSYARVVSYGQE